MNTAPHITRFMQNGTCAFGFPSSLFGLPRPSSLTDFSDYVLINYTLTEVLLTPSDIPLTVLEFSKTSRPVVFNGYMPPASSPGSNILKVNIVFCNPPIAYLESLSTNREPIPYSYDTASKIVLSPNCVSLTQRNNLHCTNENGFRPDFYGPTPNSVSTFLTSPVQPVGNAVLEFSWWQWDYSSLANQYSFIGTSISITDPIQMLIPN